MKLKNLILTFCAVICTGLILMGSSVDNYDKSKMIRENLRAFSSGMMCTCDADCPLGMRCVNGECVPGDGEGEGEKYRINCKIAGCAGDKSGNWYCNACIAKMCAKSQDKRQTCVITISGTTGHFHCVSEGQYRHTPLANCANY